MNNDIQNKLFELNTVLLSAFGDNSDIGKEAKCENDFAYSSVKNNAQKEYDSIKKGMRYSLQKETKPTKESAQTEFAKGNISKSFIDYAKLYKNNPTDKEILKNLATILIILEANTTIKKYLLKELKKYKNDYDIQKLIAEYYMKNEDYNSFKKAIPILKKLSKQKNNYNILFQLSYAYERVYQDKHIGSAIDLAKRSLEYADKNQRDFAYIQLAKYSSNIGEYKIALDYLSKVDNPLNKPEAEFFRSYVNLLAGNITEGYDAYRIRFDAMKTEYPYSLKKEKRLDDISKAKGANILIHYEQGFGDNIMFARYVQEVSKIAKETCFVCPKSLYSLFKSSGFENFCTLVKPSANIKTKKQFMSLQGHELNDIDYDYHIPVMDLPYLLKLTPETVSKNAEGYLSVEKSAIEEFKKKFIKNNNKIKIGISYHGTKSSNQTYRDIPAKEFIPLLEMDNVELYSFQVDEHSSEVTKLMKKYKNLYSLKNAFRDFKDTAAAIMNMDLMLTTDNVIMNLSGALGAKTFGIFNVYPEPRWYKTKGNDIGWYNSIRPFQANTFNDWDNLMKDIKSAIIKDFNL